MNYVKVITDDTNREREAAFECLAMNEEDATDEIQPLD